MLFIIYFNYTDLPINPTISLLSSLREDILLMKQGLCRPRRNRTGQTECRPMKREKLVMICRTKTKRYIGVAPSHALFFTSFFLQLFLGQCLREPVRICQIAW